MVRAVLSVYIVDNFLAALITEIHVKIRHRNALRIEETFEKQVIFYRVNIGYANAVCAKASGA